MNFIKKVLENHDCSLQELIDCFEKIKMNGEVAVIKFDGERSENGYTVFVTFPNNKREMIRVDDNNLKKALIKLLSSYIET